ncbi:hypothetical protein UT4_02900 [Ferrigenium sp. UT4]
MLAQSHRQQAGSCDIERLNKTRGFTLVELITVMVIVGILAVAALPRFFDNNAFQSRGAADQVAAALRYGQKVAIAQHRTAGVTVTITAAATSNCGTMLNAAGNIDCVIPNSVAVAPALPQAFVFDALGRSVPNVPASIVIGTTTLTIEAETGYVH